jgi:hypothetical protein
VNRLTQEGLSVRGKVGLVLGGFLFLLMTMLPVPAGLAPAAWRTAAVGVLMAVWWVTEAIPIPATALLPLVLFPLLGVADISNAAAPFANPIIYLSWAASSSRVPWRLQDSPGASPSGASGFSARGPAPSWPA